MYVISFATIIAGGANGEQDYIRQRVQRAQDAIQLESNLHGEKGVDAISAEAAADLKNKDLWGTQVRQEVEEGALKCFHL